jgi:hypothetical protein
MGLPIAGEFDVGVTRPIDSRTVWTGTFLNLNNIPNRYSGLMCYVSDDQNLYVFQGGATWEKIVTTNVDAVTNITENFTFNRNYNGQVLYVTSDNNVTGTLPSFGLPLSVLGSGYNVSIVQLGNGSVVFNNSPNTFFKNRLNLNRTAGKYAVASILRLTVDEFLLYGDLI